MDIRIIKNDVLTELRSKIYFNELEINRLFTSEVCSHKKTVKRLTKLIKETSKFYNAIGLLDQYVPDKKIEAVQPEVPQSEPTQPQ